jgi:6,7-dimethyl-8-ribityllumazine synthase
MSQPTSISGHLQGQGYRFAIVLSRFNGAVGELLLAGAVDALVRHGVAPENLTVVRVPGAWEIPLALEALARRGGIDGLVALGVVVRGETPHFDVVVDGCTRGAAAVSQQHRLPVGLGVLTCDTSEQAAARAGGKAGNKGAEAALAALEMADLLSRLRS